MICDAAAVSRSRPEIGCPAAMATVSSGACFAPEVVVHCCAFGDWHVAPLAASASHKERRRGNRVFVIEFLIALLSGLLSISCTGLAAVGAAGPGWVVGAIV